MRNKLAVALAGAGLLMAAAPMWAHHAFAAEFDEKRPIKLHGVVTQWELVNPHCWIHLDVKNVDGSVTNWIVEGGSPNALFRLGFTKNSLPAGTELFIGEGNNNDLFLLAMIADSSFHFFRLNIFSA